MFSTPSEKTIERVSKDIGLIIENNNELIETVVSQKEKHKGAKILSASMDGAHMHIRKEGYKSATAATITTYGDNLKDRKTTYLGHIPEENRLTIKERLIIAVKLMEKKYSFIYKVFLADGERAIWEFAKEKFRDFIHITDFFHVSEHIAKFANIYFGENNFKGKRWYKNYRHILAKKENGRDKLIRTIKYILSKKMPSSKREKLEKEFIYFKNNYDRMDYYESGCRFNQFPLIFLTLIDKF